MSVMIITGAANTNSPFVLYQNIFEEGTVTVGNETADGAGLNAIEDTTFDFWTPNGVPTQIVVDMGSPVPVDCIGVAAHTAGMAGATVQAQSSTDNTSWTTRATITPLTDETILAIFPLIEARYWRVRVSGAVASFGAIKLGKRLVIPGGVLSGHVGINHANRVDLLNNTSIRGQFLGNRIIRLGAETNINFGLVERSFVENNMLMFESHYNSGRTFFYAGSPLNYPDDYGYCWRPEGGSELRPSYEEGGDLMQLDMDVSVYVE